MEDDSETEDSDADIENLLSDVDRKNVRELIQTCVNVRHRQNKFANSSHLDVNICQLIPPLRSK